MAKGDHHFATRVRELFVMNERAYPAALAEDFRSTLASP